MVANYVLSNFDKSELETLRNEVFGKVYDRIVRNELVPESNTTSGNPGK